MKSSKKNVRKKKTGLSSLSLKISLLGLNIVITPFLLAVSALFFISGMLPQFLILIICTSLHEICHLSMAKGFGYKINEVELSPLGGVVRIKDFSPLASRPEIEAAIAIAGPMGSMVLFALGYFLSNNMSGMLTSAQLEYLDFFSMSNMMLAIFNVLPVLPLDGGRVLRSLLTGKCGLQKATQNVLIVSRVISILMIAVGVVGTILKIVNLNLCLIGIFILTYSMKGEANTREKRGWAEDIIHRRVSMDEKRMMDSIVLSVMYDVSVGEVIKRIEGDKLSLVMVISEQSNILGYLTESKLVEAAVELGINRQVGEIFTSIDGKKFRG